MDVLSLLWWDDWRHMDFSWVSCWNAKSPLCGARHQKIMRRQPKWLGFCTRCGWRSIFWLNETEQLLGFDCKILSFRVEFFAHFAGGFQPSKICIGMRLVISRNNNHELFWWQIRGRESSSTCTCESWHFSVREKSRPKTSLPEALAKLKSSVEAMNQGKHSKSWCKVSCFFFSVGKSFTLGFWR